MSLFYFLHFFLEKVLQLDRHYLLSSRNHLPSPVSFTCRRSASASKLSGKTSRMIFLPYFFSLLLKGCSAASRKTNLDLATVSFASTSLSPFSAYSTRDTSSVFVLQCACRKAENCLLLCVKESARQYLAYRAHAVALYDVRAVRAAFATIELPSADAPFAAALFSTSTDASRTAVSHFLLFERSSRHATPTPN